jgi:K(+)-stimulated pyrophosphate-energized sodium pump
MVLMAFLTSILALLAGAWFYRAVIAAPATNPRANEIAAAISAGASAFLNRQYRTVAKVGAPILVLLWVFLGGWYAGGFLVGALASAAAGFIGMNVSVRANVRVAHAAKSGFRDAFNLAFQGGAVTGLMVVGAGLLCLTAIVWIMHIKGYENPDALIGLAFGGSLISVFARLGGGIFTKGADVGADLVGKVEANIPEDDPRNPAVIADNVGDNVGDCAGMAADLFETFCVTAAAAMLLAHIIFTGETAEAKAAANVAFLYPMLVGAAGIIGTLVSLRFVKIDEPVAGQQPAVMSAMYLGLGVATAAMLVLLFVANLCFTFPEVAEGSTSLGVGLWWCALIGGIVTAAMMWITDVYTGDGSRHVDKIAKASESGHGTNVISGLAVGMQATVVPVIVIVIAIVLTYSISGLYGIAIAAMSMLSLAGIVVAIDAYGPITDNAGGIAEMAELGDEVRNVTDPLDAFGNTTKAVTKGYAIASAGLASVVLFATYIADLQSVGIQEDFSLSNTDVLAGLFIGAMIPFIFAS